MAEPSNIPREIKDAIDRVENETTDANAVWPDWKKIACWAICNCDIPGTGKIKKLCGC